LVLYLLAAFLQTAAYQYHEIPCSTQCHQKTCHLKLMCGSRFTYIYILFLTENKGCNYCFAVCTRYCRYLLSFLQCHHLVSRTCNVLYYLNSTGVIYIWVILWKNRILGLYGVDTIYCS
jgi:hypothetical protein